MGGLRAGDMMADSLPRMQCVGREYDDRPRVYAHRGVSEIFHCTGDVDISREKARYTSHKSIYRIRKPKT